MYNSKHHLAFLAKLLFRQHGTVEAAPFKILFRDILRVEKVGPRFGEAAVGEEEGKAFQAGDRVGILGPFLPWCHGCP